MSKHLLSRLSGPIEPIETLRKSLAQYQDATQEEKQNNPHYHLYCRRLGFVSKRRFLRTVKRGDELIVGMLPGKGVVVINGKSGIGKSYFVLGLALSIASGQKEFHGLPLKTTGLCVLYLAFEGVHSIPDRLVAFEQTHGSDIPEDTFFIRHALESLSNAKARDELSKDIIALRPNIVIFDTLGAATAGIDEDKAKEMGPIIEWCRDLAEGIDGLCLLVTHPPKGNINTIRGSNVLEGNTDGVIQVKPKGKGISIVPTKVRTSMPAEPLDLQFKSIDLGPCADDPTQHRHGSVLVPARPKARPIELILDELSDGRSEISVAEVISELVARGVYSKSAAYRAIDKALPLGHSQFVLNRNYTRNARKILVSDPLNSEEIQ